MSNRFATIARSFAYDLLLANRRDDSVRAEQAANDLWNHVGVAGKRYLTPTGAKETWSVARDGWLAVVAE